MPDDVPVDPMSDDQTVIDVVRGLFENEPALAILVGAGHLTIDLNKVLAFVEQFSDENEVRVHVKGTRLGGGLLYVEPVLS